MQVKGSERKFGLIFLTIKKKKEKKRKEKRKEKKKEKEIVSKN